MSHMESTQQIKMKTLFKLISATLFLSLVAPPPKESREKMKSEAATAWKCAKSSTKGGRRGALEDVDVSMKSRYGVVASIYIQMINTTINID